MPGSGGWSEISSQGTAVSFGDVPIGYLKSFDSSAEVASLEDVTNITSPVVGSGADARVVKQYDALMIEPVKLTLSFWGSPPFSASDVGTKAELAFSGAGAVISGEAVLMSIGHAGRAGEYSEGTATFQLTGA